VHARGAGTTLRRDEEKWKTVLFPRHAQKGVRVRQKIRAQDLSGNRFSSEENQEPGDRQDVRRKPTEAHSGRERLGELVVACEKTTGIGERQK